jgi:hypothetical protein
MVGRPFQKGEGGRPKGARNKLQEAFWKDFAAAWEAKGAEAIAKVAQDDPATFLKVAASVMPKDVEMRVEHRRANELTDDELASIAIAARSSDGIADETENTGLTH